MPVGNDDETWAYLKLLEAETPATDVNHGPSEPVMVSANPFYIGRGEGSHFLITNPCISSVHCVFSRIRNSSQKDDSVISFADVSSNGCYINGKRLGRGKTCELAHGDIITLVSAIKPEHAKYNLKFVFHVNDTSTDAADPTVTEPTVAESPASQRRHADGAHDNEFGITLEEDFAVNQEQCLGTGAFASVYRAVARRDFPSAGLAAKDPVAVKMINKRRLNFGNEDRDLAMEELFEKLFKMEKGDPEGFVNTKKKLSDAEVETYEKYRKDCIRQQREIDILRAMHHPHVIRMASVYNNSTKLNFVLQFAEGGEVFKLVREHSYLREPIAMVLANQLVRAVAYLHSVGIVHRDIKLENLLLRKPFHPMMIKDDEEFIKSHENGTPDREGPTSAHLLVSDFGLGRLLPQADANVMSTMCGTPIYVAPEVTMVSLRENTLGYTAAVDMWSVGVVVYAMLTGRPPYSHKIDPETGKRHKTRMDYSTSIDWSPPKSARRAGVSHGVSFYSDDAMSFIMSLLQMDPNCRLSANEALLHPWFNPLGRTADTHSGRPLLGKRKR